MKLTVETRGTGPDLVLLHGWGMNRRVWAPLADLLEARFTLHLVDLPGHGDSPWEAGCNRLAAWAEAVLESVPRQAAWAGWSLGGLVMLEALRLAPRRLTALIGIAATPCFVQRPSWSCAMEAGVLEQFAGQLARDHGGTLRRFLALQFQGVDQGREALRQAIGLLETLPAPRAQALEAGLALLRHSDLRPVLAGMDRPGRWLLGERDRLVPPALAGALPRLAPTLEIHCLSGAGHAPFLSHPGEVAGWLAGAEEP